MLIGAFAGAPAASYFHALLHPNESQPAPSYPIWCSDPNPQAGYNYSAVYFTNNGTITSFGGQTGNGFSIPGPGEAVVPISTSSFSSLVLIHSMYCYAGQGHSGQFPFHVDLKTHQVVWD